MHECEYCYARRIAKRFSGGGEKWTDDSLFVLDEKFYAEGSEKSEPYLYGFMPTFHRYRLDEYQNKKGRNIFVCSMADLFGEWVPDEWIKEVFDACEKAPQHNYLFLTKNPKRYEKLLGRYMSPNMWFGWSQTEPMEGQCSFTCHHSVKTFVSIEPLLAPFEEPHVNGINWLIIGAETGHRKNKVVPERKWIEDIVNECRRNNIPVFMKSSLTDIWGKDLIQEFPEELRSSNEGNDTKNSRSC